MDKYPIKKGGAQYQMQLISEDKKEVIDQNSGADQGGGDLAGD